MPVTRVRPIVRLWIAYNEVGKRIELTGEICALSVYVFYSMNIYTTISHIYFNERPPTRAFGEFIASFGVSHVDKGQKQKL